MVQHGFTELVNNAADHSGGSSVTVSLRQTPTHVQLLVSDDGIGVFDKICSAFQLEDPQHAMLELSKGRLTSAPDAHTGRGLFFSSQLADVFDIHANNTAYQRRAWESAGWKKGRALPRQGSSIYMAIALNTTRTLDGVMDDLEPGAATASSSTRPACSCACWPAKARPWTPAPQARRVGSAAVHLQARGDRLRRRHRRRPRLHGRALPRLRASANPQIELGGGECDAAHRRRW